MSDDAKVTNRWRRRSRSFGGVSLLVVLVATACSSRPPAIEADAPAVATDTVATVDALPRAPEPRAIGVEAGGTVRPSASIPTPTPHPVAQADTELPPAPIGLDALAESASANDGARPTSLAILDIGVTDARVIPVGVNADQSFEVPPADQVGWYRFGPTPGADGSAVLAAHIAFDGVDGVFRHLADTEVGAIVEVGFADGTSQRYRVQEVTEYDKQQLPQSLWARSGSSQLALITCGGTFNPELRAYESNTVAIAVPL